MKQAKNILAAAALLALPIAFTSCEDVLGHWEKPVPATPVATTEEPAVVAAADQYLEWSTTDNKLVAQDIPTGYVSMTDGLTPWNGNYIVESDVTISTDVSISGDVNIILKDGYTLTVKGHVDGNHKLCIFAQNSDATAAGKLVIAPTSMAGSASSALSVSELQIHGGDITATGHDNSSADGDDGLKTSGKMFFYAGKVTAKGGSATGGSGNGGIGINCNGVECHIYKAEVTATGGNSTPGSGGNGIACGGSGYEPALTIDGGIVKATAGDGTFSYGVHSLIYVNSGEFYAHGNSSGKGVRGPLYWNASLIAEGGNTDAYGTVIDNSNNDNHSIDAITYRYVRVK